MRAAVDFIEGQAQALGGDQRTRADLVLVCVEAGGEPTPDEMELLRQKEPAVVGIATKCDLSSAASPDWIATSRDDRFRARCTCGRLLAERVRARAQPALAPSLSRCREHVDACLDRLRRAHSLVLYEDPPELVALELRAALEQLGAMVGAVYTDDLLDRIFSRFCIGK